MIVHRLLDAFFRGLDAVDAARDRVDTLLGREPRPDPWAVDWPPPDEAFPHEPPATTPAEPETNPDNNETAKAAAPKASKAAKKTSASSAAATKKAGRKKSSSSKRKGSVDRSGKDLTTERAARVATHIEKQGLRLVDAEDEIEGKKVLARVVWALVAAHRAQEADGMTTKDVSALLSQAAGIEVFTTNIGRACRDHDALIQASTPEGRSKRYRLTAKGVTAGASLIGGE